LFVKIFLDRLCFNTTAHYPTLRRILHPDLGYSSTNHPPGVFTFFAVKGVAYGLRNIVDLTTVHKPPPRPEPSNPGKEDAIKTSSLQLLATASNVEIRKAATKILCQRFITNPKARSLLARDLASQDPDTQHLAQLAFDLLNDYNVFHQSPSTGIDDLRRAVPGWAPNTARYPGPPGTRDAAERDLRRRRREAMVLNEGDRPVGQEDVFMRDTEGRLSMDETSRPTEEHQGMDETSIQRAARDVVTEEEILTPEQYRRGWDSLSDWERIVV
jgi:hypothetical protein